VLVLRAHASGLEDRHDYDHEDENDNEHEHEHDRTIGGARSIPPTLMRPIVLALVLVIVLDVPYAAAERDCRTKAAG
jgi:hypothetical protein